MNIELRPAEALEKAILRNLMELYIYDFTEFTCEDADGRGRYGYTYLPRYWKDPDRFPYLVRIDGQLAGFVLVRRLQPGVHSIAEFFVMKKFRKQNVGRKVALRIFEQFPGGWRVSQIPENLPAQAFWRRIIGEYTGGKFTEEVEADGCIVQVFNNKEN